MGIFTFLLASGLRKESHNGILKVISSASNLICRLLGDVEHTPDQEVVIKIKYIFHINQKPKKKVEMARYQKWLDNNNNAWQGGVICVDWR